MNSCCPFQRSRMQLLVMDCWAPRQIRYPPRREPSMTDVSSDQITFFQSSRVQCSWSLQNFNRAFFIALVNPGFRVGFVFLIPAARRIRHIVVGEIAPPNSKASCSHDFSRPHRSFLSLRITSSLQVSCFRSRPHRGESFTWSRRTGLEGI